MYVIGIGISVKLFSSAIITTYTSPFILFYCLLMGKNVMGTINDLDASCLHL